MQNWAINDSTNTGNIQNIKSTVIWIIFIVKILFLHN